MSWFDKLTDKISDLVSKKQEPLTEEEEFLRELLPEKGDYDFSLPVKRVIENFDPAKKNLVIIDDSKGIVSVVQDMLEELHKEGRINIEEYNVLPFFDKYAPFVMEETLNELGDIKVDLAIIDIILPGKMKRDGKYFKKDGVDVAHVLNRKYGCENFVFFTGNVVSEYIEFIREKVERFHKYFGKHIKEHMIFKGDNDDGESTKFEFERLFKGDYNTSKSKVFRY